MEFSFRTGISKETISLIERELTNVTLDVLERLAAYTGLTVSELFTEDFVEGLLLQSANEANAD
jgi:transcriptional regulator with XRE-family HTH domain